jgi:hypothetical protein
MAKATSSRKPARVKRKGAAAAKRAAARKPVARARKVTGKVTTAKIAKIATIATDKTARLRRSPRLEGRPSARRPQQAGSNGLRAAAVGGAAPEATKPPVREPERVPPPLPVPIASFTF